MSKASEERAKARRNVLDGLDLMASQWVGAGRKLIAAWLYWAAERIER